MVMLVFLVTLLLTLAMGMPIAYSLLLSGIALMAWQGVPDPQVAALTIINGNDNHALLAIPFFLMAGELMNAGGLSRRLVSLVSGLVGHYRGGMGYVTVLIGLVLAALSGSAVADAAAMAGFLLPMMRGQGHDAGRSAGLVACSGLLAPIVPPSIALVFYGVMTNTSVAKLFLAGVFPGLLMAAVLALTWGWMVRRESSAARPRAPWPQVLRDMRAAGWALGMPVIIILGLRFGVVTPTESSVVAALYAGFVALVVYRELPLAVLPGLALSALVTSAVVMLIMACSALASWMITVSGMSAQLVEWVSPLAGSPRLLVAMICALVLLLGTAIEPGPLLLMLTPLLMPVVSSAGVDLVYFGVVYVIAGVLGMVTPPVGAVLAVVAGAGKLDFGVVARGSAPFVATQVLLLALLVAFPALVTVPAGWFARG